MSVVLDASMTIAWFFATERQDAARAVLRRVAAQGATVPSLWRLEVANVLKNAVRRGRCRADYADRSLARLARLRIAVDLETDAQAWGATRQLALEHDLTLYDAAYLELAIRRRQPLASCDIKLIGAATAIGVEVYTPTER
jgi:predicted nucleic acid-binding protein